MQEKDKKDLRGRGFSLEDLIDIKEWQKIQNNFSAITEVNLRTVNSNGNLITLPSRKPRLCDEILKGPSFKNRFCEKCLPTFLGGNEAVDKNLSFICQAGLSLERTLREALQKKLFSTKDELDKVKIELSNAQKQLTDVNNELALAQSNNIKLLEGKNTLEAKFHSLTELKQAIRQVKREMWQERYQQILAKKETQKEIGVKKLTEGNRGFLLKDGKPTYKLAIKIEVRPGY